MIKGQDFGEALESDHATFISTPFDGVFGLAFPELAKPGTINPLQRLCTDKQLKQCLFSVWLMRDSFELGGELHLGEVDSRMFVGELHWVPVSNRPYLQVDLERVWFEGQEDLAVNVQGLLDTGSSIISVPPSHIKQVDQILGVTEYINGYGLLDCRNVKGLPRLNIQMGGKVSVHVVTIGVFD